MFPFFSQCPSCLVTDRETTVQPKSGSGSTTNKITQTSTKAQNNSDQNSFKAHDTQSFRRPSQCHGPPPLFLFDHPSRPSTNDVLGLLVLMAFLFICKSTTSLSVGKLVAFRLPRHSPASNVKRPPRHHFILPYVPPQNSSSSSSLHFSPLRHALSAWAVAPKTVVDQRDTAPFINCLCAATDYSSLSCSPPSTDNRILCFAILLAMLGCSCIAFSIFS